MSDNIFVTPGTGKEIAADDVGGVLHQRVKLTLGADGVSNGDVSATNPLPTVDLAPLFSNSTAAIAAGGTYTSSTFDTTTGRMYLTFSIFSVTDLTTYFEESSDGSNWTTMDTRFINTGTANHGSSKCSGQFARLRVVNGTTPNPGGVSNLNILISQGIAITNTAISVEDGYGDSIGSVSTGSALNGLAVANVATAYKFSTVNSTVAQLAASATFTGTPEVTYNQPSYSILLVSDQPGTLTINQYIDASGTQLVLVETFTLAANEKFARSNVVNGNYVSISYQNTGASATTTLRIDTAYGMIPSSTQLNNAPMALREVNGSPISLGQTTMVNSLPVVIASNQGAIPTSSASLPLPTGAATAALQTQPGVDIGDVTINNASGASAVNIQDGGNSITVDGTVTANAGSGTFAISASSLPLPSGAATSANQATEISSLSTIATNTTGLTVTQGSTTSGQTGQLVQGAVTTNPPAYTTAQTSPVSITPSGYLRVIEEKDEGRNQTNYFMALQIVTTATDTLQSLTGYKSGAAVTATTTPAVVSSTKTYRITSISITYVAIATAGSAHFTLRANTGGTVVIGSPAVISWQLGGPAAAAGVSQTANYTFPDGIEFAAGTGIGVSMIGRGATGTAAAVGYGQIAINGYEY